MDKVLIATLLVGFFCSKLFANPYQTEITIGAADSNVGDPLFNLGIQFYLNEVKTEHKPWAEAAFLSKSTNLYARSYYTLEGGEQSTSAGLELFLPNTMFYGEVMAFEAGDKIRWSANAGVTPIDGLLITTNIDEDSSYQPNLSVKYVKILTNKRAINIEAGGYDGEDGVYSMSFATDFYFTHTTSVGMELKESSYYSEGVLRAKHFFSNELYAATSFSKWHSNRIIMLEAGLRF